jgi:hypothetical protein
MDAVFRFFRGHVRDPPDNKKTPVVVNAQPDFIAVLKIFMLPVGRSPLQ